MILAGYHGSENARRALNRAIELTKESKGELRIAAVADIASYVNYATGGVYRQFHDNTREHAKNLLADASDIARQGGIANVYGSVEDNQPADMILTLASEYKADLIVVGRRGIRGIERFLMASVSSAVINNAKCDVLVVK